MICFDASWNFASEECSVTSKLLGMNERTAKLSVTPSFFSEAWKSNFTHLWSFRWFITSSRIRRDARRCRKVWITSALRRHRWCPTCLDMTTEIDFSICWNFFLFKNVWTELNKIKTWTHWNSCDDKSSKTFSLRRSVENVTGFGEASMKLPCKTWRRQMLILWVRRLLTHKNCFHCHCHGVSLHYIHYHYNQALMSKFYVTKKISFIILMSGISIDRYLDW